MMEQEALVQNNVGEYDQRAAEDFAREYAEIQHQVESDKEEWELERQADEKAKIYGDQFEDSDTEEAEHYFQWQTYEEKRDPAKELQEELNSVRELRSRDLARIEELTAAKRQSEEQMARILDESSRNVATTVSDYEAKLERAQSRTQCQICMERTRNTLLLPCCHFLYCSTCLSQMQDRNRCPTCRQTIQGQIACNLGL
eukprot:TRINITY_DN13967_c0_g1_i4.p1 TRINITY_DN13967_c0_g1~~TRINITY_DN13967_c0_g1_i4.p1  ORF type:complete len:232 (-),score=29.51 TRINITY_DN13967_c0_g1_i4:21-620(-)